MPFRSFTRADDGKDGPEAEDGKYGPYLVGRRGILVIHSQGNPLLKHIHNMSWEFSDVVYGYTTILRLLFAQGRYMEKALKHAQRR